MITLEKIEEIVNSHLEGTEHFLTEIDLSPAGQLSVYVDSFEYFTLDDCASLMRVIRKEFGEALDNYDLTVSSAGMDRPFKSMKQYHKNLNREVKVVTFEGKSISGILSKIGDESVFVEEAPRPAKKGMKVSAKAAPLMHEIAFNNIKETKRIINFK